MLEARDKEQIRLNCVSKNFVESSGTWISDGAMYNTFFITINKGAASYIYGDEKDDIPGSQCTPISLKNGKVGRRDLVNLVQLAWA